MSKVIRPTWNTLLARDYLCITLIQTDNSMTIYLYSSKFLFIFFFCFSSVWLSQCASECGEWSVCLVDRSTWQHPHLLDWRWSRGLQGLSVWLKSKKEYANLSWFVKPNGISSFIESIKFIVCTNFYRNSEQSDLLPT